MRFVFAILAAFALAQCASNGEDDRFYVGRSPRAYIIIGVAEASTGTDAAYTMLWRRLDSTGRFIEEQDRWGFEARTNSRSTVRVRDIPGEFRRVETDPGVYALDSVFAVIRENRVNYFANGVVLGPERPAFEVRAGEAIYLGIWETRVEETTAVAQLWRLDGADLRAVLSAASDDVSGPIVVRETHTRAVPCEPRRMNNVSQRQAC